MSPATHDVIATCPVCAGELAVTRLHCAECGTTGMVVLTCARCGDTLSLPGHLLRHRWESRPLHCRTCGEALPRPPEGSKDGTRTAA